jgi:hypothetical protein
LNRQQSNSNGTRYTTSDTLGSPRVVTNSSASVVSRHDFMPFGEELGGGTGGRTTGMGYSVADGLRQKFTQKERDNDVPIILDKRSSIVAHHMVSRDLREAASKRYQEEAHYEDSGPNIPVSRELPTDDSNFVIIRPGESFKVESAWTRVNFCLNDGTPHFKDCLHAGSYFLQVEVGTWLYATEKIATKLRHQWKDKGYLWSDSLTSLPMPFTLQANHPISKCQ